MNIISYLRSHIVLSTGLGLVVIIASIIGGRVASRNHTEVSNISNIKKVSLVDVSDFRDDVSRVTADGIIESVSQVDLRSQTSGPISSINVSIGDNISKGQVILTLQNADIRAQLDQARAGLRLVQGQYTNNGSSLEAPRRTALETLQSSYIVADEVINIDLSPFLYYQTGGNQKLSSFINDRNLDESIRSRYINEKEIASSWKKDIDALTTSSSNTEIQKVITSSQSNLKEIGLLLDDILQVINSAIKGVPISDTYNTLASWQNTVSADRNKINSAIKNLTNTGSDLSGSDAQISSAQAMVKNLEAQLSKTIFTSPISGKIAALPLRMGELALPGQLIATIVGGGGLQVRAYASGEDFNKITAGSSVLIDKSIKGKVISVAPSVSTVNKKVETVISIDDSDQSGLVVGQSVDVSIESNKNTTNTSKNNIYLLPIQDVKIIPGSAYVFTVDNDSKIVKNLVTVGKVSGDFIEITDGISIGMKIVSPVYELEEGQVVNIQ